MHSEYAHFFLCNINKVAIFNLLHLIISQIMHKWKEAPKIHLVVDFQKKKKKKMNKLRICYSIILSKAATFLLTGYAGRC
jgi:hypothetical protein